jgi:dTDP-4-dehydrorhamnose 3,5-epimerase-like enzyme
MLTKIALEKLPNTKEIDGAKHWEEEKGEFAQIAYGEEIHHLAFFELRKGYTRGNHYHKEKQEVFYVARGKIEAEFRDLESDEVAMLLLERGDKLRVEPGVWHLFSGLEDALVVEYSPQQYDKSDTFPLDR